MAVAVTVTAGAQGFTLAFTVNGDDAAALDLTPYDVSLLVSGSVLPCEVVDGPAGRADYVTAGDEFVPGKYRAQLRLDAGDQRFFTSYFQLVVTKSAA